MRTPMIENNLSIFRPRKMEGGPPSAIFISGGFFVGSLIGLLFSTSVFHLVQVVAFAILFPLVIFGYIGNTDRRLSVVRDRRGYVLNNTKKVQVWNRYRSLPKELQKKVVLTASDVGEMTEADATAIFSSMQSLESHYNTKQRRLNQRSTPRAAAVLEILNAEVTDLKLDNRAAKEIDNA